MEEHSRLGLLRSGFLFVFLLSFINSTPLVQGANQESDGYNALCNTNLASFLPFPYSSLPNMICKPLWNSYLLRVCNLISILHLISIISTQLFHKFNKLTRLLLQYYILSRATVFTVEEQWDHDCAIDHIHERMGGDRVFQRREDAEFKLHCGMGEPRRPRKNKAISCEGLQTLRNQTRRRRIAID